MYAALASLFFSVVAGSAMVVIAMSLFDNAGEIRDALGFGGHGVARIPTYRARVRRTSRPYRPSRAVPSVRAVA
jgi:hypothetical protein